MKSIILNLNFKFQIQFSLFLLFERKHETSN